MEFEPPIRRPSSHVCMLGLVLGSLMAFMVFPGEGYKLLVGLFTFVLMVIVCLTCLAWISRFRPQGGLIALAAALCVGSCGSQLGIFSHDLTHIVHDMQRFDCREARRIASTQRGFGRSWVADQENRWRGEASGPFGFHDLFLTYVPGPDRFELAVPYPDMPRAYVECTPDPSKPAAVNVINSTGGLLRQPR